MPTTLTSNQRHILKMENTMRKWKKTTTINKKIRGLARIQAGSKMYNISYEIDSCYPWWCISSFQARGRRLKASSKICVQLEDVRKIGFSWSGSLWQQRLLKDLSLWLSIEAEQPRVAMGCHVLASSSPPPSHPFSSPPPPHSSFTPHCATSPLSSS